MFFLYLLPLGSIFRKYGIPFHCCADDTQIYLPLKQKDANSFKLLFDCLTDINTWMALDFLNFNESKTEVLILGPSGASDTPHMHLCSLEPYIGVIITVILSWTNR